MSAVRKRKWFTRQQRKRVDPEAKKLAQAAGKPTEWGAFQYLERAGTALGIEPQSTWICDYTDADGDQHIKSFETKKDAEKYAATVTVDIDAGRHTAPSKSITLTEAAERWIKRVESVGRERTTVRQYRQHVNLHIAPRLGRFKLAQLTPGKVEAFRDDLLEKLSRPMARKVLTSLKSLLKVNKMSHVADDVSIPGENGRKRKLEAGRDLPTVAEVQRLIASAEAQDDKGKRHALLLTAALTGLRASELRGLRWSDVDLKAEELHVRQRADRYSKIGEPKSKAGTRSIPIPPELLTALKAWKLACPNGEEGLVFPSSTGRIEHHANMLRSLGPVMKAAGVVGRNGKPKYALHAFRHFFASWCINPKSRGGRELSPKMVQQLLGHGSIVMTLDVYGHMFPKGDDKAELAEASALLFAKS
jgi:integrase